MTTNQTHPTQPIPIPVDELIHTDEHPFCYSDPCLCHEDPDAIAQVHQYYLDGLVSADDATRIVQGKTL